VASKSTYFLLVFVQLSDCYMCERLFRSQQRSVSVIPSKAARSYDYRINEPIHFAPIDA
jgi:hypothetical protein